MQPLLKDGDMEYLINKEIGVYEIAKDTPKDVAKRLSLMIEGIKKQEKALLV